MLSDSLCYHRAAALSLSLWLTLSANWVTAANLDFGEQLYKQNCTRCHQTDIHTRPDRIVNNLQHLRSQVQFCEVSNDLSWFDEEVDAVTEYLNQNYYMFDLK